MPFSSLEFIAFAVTVFTAYWLIGGARPRLQAALLLAASYGFYARWNWRFLALVAGLSAANYVLGKALGGTSDPRRRRLLLILAIVANLGALLVFKYLQFFLASFGMLLAAIGLPVDLPVLRLLAPLGISFYTLQMLTYPLGVHGGRIQASRQPLEFFAFCCFFPLLTAGPIERAAHLLPQFQQSRRFEPAAVHDGLRQILNGLFKKLVIADNLAPLLRAPFAEPGAYDGGTLVLAAIGFAFQVYCDFAGYSDIAIGVGRLFGFSLTRNFRYPFFSRDIGEFWRRWHISLSNWLRDYVFFPLGAGYGSRPRQVLNVFVTFLASGLWHGANWTFVFWGGLNALYFLPLIMNWRLVTYKGDVAPRRLLPSPREALSIMLTFVAVALAFVFFRAETLAKGFAFVERIFTQPWSFAGAGVLLAPLAACGALTVIEWVQRKRQYALEIPSLPIGARWSVYVACLLAMLVFGHVGSQGFIYQQF